MMMKPKIKQKREAAEVERRLSVVEELESVVSANLQRATRPGQGAEEAAQQRDIVRHRMGGQRYAPLRDEFAVARHWGHGL